MLVRVGMWASGNGQDSATDKGEKTGQGWTSLEVIGRETELAEVAGVLAAGRNGPAGLHLVGPAGVGKTVLLRAARTMAKEQGDRTVLVATATQHHGAVPYGGLADLVAPIASLVDKLPPTQQQALAVAVLAEAAPPKEGVERNAVAAAVTGLLRQAAEASPTVLILDDLQWFDESSRSVLAYAFRRIEAEPIATITAARRGPKDEAFELGSLLGRDTVRERAVEGLTVDQLVAIVRQQLGALLSVSTAIRLHEATNGNPLLALEIARVLATGRQGVLDFVDDLPLPDRFERALADRVDTITPAARQVATVVAALTRPTVGLLRQALPGPAVLSGLQAAVDANVVETQGEELAIFHPLARAYLLDRLDESARRGLHERLAQLVTDRYERAAHLAASAAQPDQRIADDVANAAQEASLRGAPATAAALAEEAARLTPADDETSRADRYGLAADARFRAGNTDLALDLAERALHSAPQDRAGSFIHRIGRIQLERDGIADALPKYELAIQLTTDRGERALLYRDLAVVTRYVESPRAALKHAQAAVELADQVTDPAIQSECIATLAHLHFNSGLGIPEDLLERGVALEREHHLPVQNGSVRLTEVLIRTWSGRPDRSLPLVRRIIDEAVPDDAVTRTYALYHRGIAEWRSGHWTEARATAEQVVQLVDQLGWGTRGAFLWLRSMVAAHLGDLDRARTDAIDSITVSEHTGERTWVPLARWILGFVALSEGDTQGTVAMLKESDKLRQSGDPAGALYLPDFVEALVATGQVAVAEAAMEPWEQAVEELGRVEAHGVRARCRALVLAAKGQVDQAIEELRPYTSAEGWESYEPFQVARNDLTFGQLGTGDKQAIAAAARGFRALGAVVWEAKALAL